MPRLSKSPDTRKRSDRADDSKQVDALLAQAENLLNENPALCVSICDKAIRKGNTLAPNAAMARCFALRGLASRRLGNHPLSLRSLRHAFALYERVKLPEKAAAVLSNIGLILYDMGNYTAALESYHHALRLCQPPNGKVVISILFNNIGNIYREWRDSERAISYYHESLKLKQEIADEAGMAHPLNNLANEYTALKQYAKADKCYSQALQLHRKFGDKRGEAALYSNFAELYAKTGRMSEALSALQQALGISEALKDRLLIARIWLQIGQVNLLQRRFEESLHFLHKAMKLLKLLNAQNLLYECHYALYELHKQTGNPVQALQHHERFYTVKTSVLGDELNRKLKNLELTMELGKEHQKTEVYRTQVGTLKGEAAEKTKEIAAMAVHLIEKNGVLSGLHSRAATLANEPKKKRRMKLLKEMLVTVVAAMDSEKDWTAFERQFTYLHPEFLSVLSKTFPALTPTELKICTLLKVQMTTKDIAALLHRSVRTVEGQRQILRRKLGVANAAALTSFLSKF